jgi:uncharacterized protein YutE (UPF0331/DUF86 family)
MVDANVVSEKLKQLALRIAKVRENRPAYPEDLTVGSNTLDVLSFNLLVAVQLCLDLATHLISDEGWEPAATAGEAFERLEQRGVITKGTAHSLRRAVGLRNVVAHDYSGIEPGRIHAAAMTGLNDLERFAAELSAWIHRRIGELE